MKTKNKMKTLKVLSIVLFLFCIAGLTSCKKDYQGTVSFWINQETSDSLLNNGATALGYYIDGESIGSSFTNISWPNAPDCGGVGSVYMTLPLGKKKEKTFTYTVKDQADVLRWSGTVNVNYNECTMTQLIW